MASKWLCKMDGVKVGPVTFQELVELVRAGGLGEDDLVTRETVEHWVPAREVVGLFRSAGKQPAEEASKPDEPEPKVAPAEVAAARGSPPSAKAVPVTEPPKPAPSAAAASAETDEPVTAAEPSDLSGPAPKRFRPGKRGWLAIAGVLAVVVAAFSFNWWSSVSESRRFPEPSRGKAPPENNTLFADIRARPPEVPSVPGLKERVATLVPGLEEISPASYPSLSADLRIIVFSAQAKPDKINLDLYMATREEVSQPFGPPQKIKSCATGRWEADPALSPDGLDLVFFRANVKTHFFYTRRDSLSSDFGKPTLWPNVPVDETKERVGHPRFWDSQRLVYNVAAVPKGGQTFWVAERTSPQGPLGEPKETAFEGLAPRACLSQDGLRSYFGIDTGLFLAFRKTTGEAFTVMKIIDAAESGPVNSPVWVCPAEDVIFYSSPGPGEKVKSPSKLWMIRL